jgi:hypothetical protein
MSGLTINRDRLVIQSVVGRIHHPTMTAALYRHSHNGESRVLPGVGGITYNVKIGDSVYAMECDHVEPGVSLKNADDKENVALHTLACIGNPAQVITGEAKGAKGFVTGTHGGIDHTLCYFAPEDLDKMAPDDKILIRAQGQGMRINELPDIFVMNMAPELFDKLGCTLKDGKLVLPVAAKCPAHLMGSGIGSSTAHNGDYDIMTADWDEIVKHGLDKLRYGDIVLLENCDTSHGRGFLTGAVTIGIVVHSDCTVMGHGPGVTTLITAKTPIIEGYIDSKANLADYFGV